VADELLDQLPDDALSDIDILKNLNGLQAYAASEQVILDRPISKDNNACYRASNIRPERSGIHAKVEILIDGIPLRWSNFNIERDEDRVRMANGAHSMLGAVLKELYPKAAIKADLDMFCWQMWDVHLSSQEAEYVSGDAEEPLHFLLNPYIITGGGTILFAPPGRGKSYTALLMGVSVDSGTSQHWKDVAMAPTLFVNLERSAASVRRRLGLVNIALGLDPQRPLLTLNARGRSLVDVQDAVRRSIDRHQVEFLVLDSISRAGQGSLTEDRSSNTIIDTLNNLGPTWLGLAHTPRKDESHVFGSVHFDAGADVILQLVAERKQDTLGIALKITKENDIGRVPIKLLAYEFNERGLTEVRNAKPGEFAVLESKQDVALPEQIEEVLLDNGKMSASDVADLMKMDRTLVSRILNHDGRFLKLGREGGHSVMFGVKQS
jgi:hypothetical protein